MPEPLCFITGNAYKLREVQRVLPEVQGWDFDLPEIQHTDARRVIEAKLLEAARLSQHPRLLVEDTSLYLDAFHGLPGPLTKWFIQPDSLGLEDLAQLALKRGQSGAQATTWLGLLERQANGIQLRFFSGTVPGEVVLPQGSGGFGWDPIFRPQGASQTFAQMDASTKQRHSMRSLALQALQSALQAEAQS